jgi:hypothetical protein
MQIDNLFLPEKRLMANVIRQALLDLWRYRYHRANGSYTTTWKEFDTPRKYKNRFHSKISKENHDRRAHDSAEQWFSDIGDTLNECPPPGYVPGLGFELCSWALGIDPEKIRAVALNGPPKGVTSAQIKQLTSKSKQRYEVKTL